MFVYHAPLTRVSIRSPLNPDNVRDKLFTLNYHRRQSFDFRYKLHWCTLERQRDALSDSSIYI